jgi:hypothetical protein
MAIIDGKLPKVAQDVPGQLIVKLKRAQTPAFLNEAVNLLEQVVPGARPRPMVGDEEKLSSSARAVLANYVVIDLPQNAKAEVAIERLANLPGVEEAYLAGGVCPPPVNAVDDPRSANQNYLDAAPDGIGARFAWGWVDGSGTGFVDLEQGWTLNHEDLAAAGITIISGVSQAFTGHGTAVLGEVAAADNTIGGIGIAPETTTRVVSQWRTASSGSTPAAILSAADNMAAGDVLLLEAQTTIGSSTYLPVEAESATFDALRHAVDQGIIVVEAGGNGSNDLDAFRDSNGKAVLDRNSADFKDSGAIMVGAASSAAPHQRLGFSNYGSRIDCYAWGENINTCGDGWQGNLTNSYTTGFGGTSGASPIVTGAALLMQNWFKSYEGSTLEPDEMRSLLSDPAMNTSSANPSADRIGVMPNLRALIEFRQRIRRIRDLNRYASFVQILVGIIDDSPGFIWVPGKGPVPVNPGWGRMVSEINPAQRDLIAALAISEISKQMTDRSSRKALATQSVKAMRSAVERIAKSEGR